MIADNDTKVRIVEELQKEGARSSELQLLKKFTFRYGEGSISVAFGKALVKFLNKKLFINLTKEQLGSVHIILSPGECQHYYRVESNYYFLNIEVFVSAFISFRCSIVWPKLDLKSNPDIQKEVLADWKFEFLDFDLKSYQNLMPDIVVHLHLKKQRLIESYKERTELRTKLLENLSLLKLSKFDYEWGSWLVRNYGVGIANSMFFKMLRAQVKSVLIEQLCGGKPEEYQRYVQANISMTSPKVGLKFPLPVFPNKYRMDIEIIPFGIFAEKVSIYFSSCTADRFNFVLNNSKLKQIIIEVSRINKQRADNLFTEWKSWTGQ